MSNQRRFSWLAGIKIVLFSLLIASCASPAAQDIDQHIQSIVQPYRFSIAKWEFTTLAKETSNSFRWPMRTRIDDVETVTQYFNSGGHDQALEDKAEIILTKQIKEALAEEGILNPMDSLFPVKFVFPPLNFEVEPLPNLLVISPRDEIRLLKRTTLIPDLTIERKESVESQVDALDVSSLVVGLGGIGFTYPTMIAENANLRFTITTIIEEWFHQYMAFQPLGFLYLLDAVGVRPNYEIIIMNETVAGIVSKEIGARVYHRYYVPEGETSTERKPDLEFIREMREIRMRVDDLLAQGKIDEVEEFMRERRDFLAAKGYHIRKLNQAYFAFHGTYADEPTAVSPIGADLKELRSQCSSLKEFINKVTGMTSYEDLNKEMEVIKQ